MTISELKQTLSEIDNQLIKCKGTGHSIELLLVRSTVKDSLIKALTLQVNSQVKVIHKLQDEILKSIKGLA